ncbi:hypothetical protein J1N35_005840 [Gossypium stocksii]|uniref:Myb/SANT-like domain-containing protein n=1 Tax=Gossypium stocksii TaxID=47602 RepID=A0A9D3WG27_9ROSI|nr:hypothetical protein J1N35_005840 [Gossypium stocksii]
MKKERLIHKDNLKIGGMPLKKEWKSWKKLKGKDTGLGWNPMKGTIDASDDW